MNKTNNIKKKNNINKLFLILLICITCTFLITGCNKNNNDINKNINNKNDSDKKLNIIATIFPTYDFARKIVGDKGNVTMLLPTGAESHSYEPSPKDIIAINNSDLFIYTGDYMETWAKDIIDSLDNKELNILNATNNLMLIKSHSLEELEHNEYAYSEEEKNEIKNINEETDEHSSEYDPHVWTDPINCITIIHNICDELVLIDPENEQYYTNNAEKYITELSNLDSEIKNIVSSGKRNELIFGTRFALLYFTNRYGLNYEAAYDTCSNEVEPSVKRISELINKIKKEKIPVIYYEELTDPKIARSIAEETGAEMLLFHSCHNVSKEEFNFGVTYLDLMKQNVENLKKGLN